MLAVSALEQIPVASLEALEGHVQAAFRTGRLGPLKPFRVPHGACIFRLPGREGEVTAQRIASFDTVAQFTRYRTAFDSYAGALDRAGITLWPTAIVALKHEGGTATAYALQPEVPEEARLSHIAAACDPDELLSLGNRLCDHVEDVVNDDVGLDATLAHWALVDDELYYLAAATPRLKSAEGGDAMQLAFFVASLPGLVQGFAQRNVVADLFEPFYSVRSVLLTLLCRRPHPEDRARLELWLDMVNARTGTPITVPEVDSAADDEAKRTRWITRMRRLNAAFQRLVLRRPYPHFFVDGDAPEPK